MTSQQYFLSDFDFQLPDQLIAQHPAQKRSQSRLLDARDAQHSPIDCHYFNLPDMLNAGDLLVFNDTRVLNARLYGKKISGGHCELLIERVLSNNMVAAHLRVSKKPAVGAELILDTTDNSSLKAKLLGRWPDENGQLFCFELSSDNGSDTYELLDKHGHVPLPPYITHSDGINDKERYQTVFARHLGAVAAPTAALHFDEALLARLSEKQIEHAFVTLHVGAGTFSPIKCENIQDHIMHSEWYQIPEHTIEAIKACRKRKGRVVAVGTTSVRTLESWASTGKTNGDTSIFITPGFKFKVADLLITNFHLPKSTLMLLISAFAGYEHIKATYQCAIKRGYRFFSYGDGMILTCNQDPSNRNFSL